MSSPMSSSTDCMHASSRVRHIFPFAQTVPRVRARGAKCRTPRKTQQQRPCARGVVHERLWPSNASPC